MRRSRALLFSLVAVFCYVSVTAQVADGTLLEDGYHYKKTSSSSKTSSFSESNGSELELNSVLQGRPIEGKQSFSYSKNGSSHSENTSFSSGFFSGQEPNNFFTGTPGDSDKNVQISRVGVLSQPGTTFLNVGENASLEDERKKTNDSSDEKISGTYWWMAEGSLFKPQGRCNTTGCFVNGHFQTVNSEGNTIDNSKISVNNPFFKTLHGLHGNIGHTGATFGFGSHFGSGSGINTFHHGHVGTQGTHGNQNGGSAEFTGSHGGSTTSEQGSMNTGSNVGVGFHGNVNGQVLNIGSTGQSGSGFQLVSETSSQGGHGGLSHVIFGTHGNTGLGGFNCGSQSSQETSGSTGTGNVIIGSHHGTASHGGVDGQVGGHAGSHHGGFEITTGTHGQSVTSGSSNGQVNTQGVGTHVTTNGIGGVVQGHFSFGSQGATSNTNLGTTQTGSQSMTGIHSENGQVAGLGGSHHGSFEIHTGTLGQGGTNGLINTQGGIGTHEVTDGNDFSGNIGSVYHYGSRSYGSINGQVSTQGGSHHGGFEIGTATTSQGAIGGSSNGQDNSQGVIGIHGTTIGAGGISGSLNLGSQGTTGHTGSGDILTGSHHSTASQSGQSGTHFGQLEIIPGTHGQGSTDGSSNGQVNIQGTTDGIVGNFNFGSQTTTSNTLSAILETGHHHGTSSHGGINEQVNGHGASHHGGHGIITGIHGHTVTSKPSNGQVDIQVAIDAHKPSSSASGISGNLNFGSQVATGHIGSGNIVTESHHGTASHGGVDGQVGNHGGFHHGGFEIITEIHGQGEISGSSNGQVNTQGIGTHGTTNGSGEVVPGHFSFSSQGTTSNINVGSTQTGSQSTTGVLTEIGHSGSHHGSFDIHTGTLGQGGVGESVNTQSSFGTHIISTGGEGNANYGSQETTSNNHTGNMQTGSQVVTGIHGGNGQVGDYETVTGSHGQGVTSGTTNGQVNTQGSTHGTTNELGGGLSFGFNGSAFHENGNEQENTQGSLEIITGTSSHEIDGASNTQSGHGSNINGGLFSHGSHGFIHGNSNSNGETNHNGGSNIDFHGEGGHIQCNGKGIICISKHLCNNGYVSLPGVTQVKHKVSQNPILCCTQYGHFIKTEFNIIQRYSLFTEKS